MTREVSLIVNDQPISLDYFVQGFIDHTVAGMLAGLEGVNTIRTVELTIEGDKVAINLNNAPLPLNPFVGKVIRNTTLGMISTLKDVGEVNGLRISAKR